MTCGLCSEILCGCSDFAWGVAPAIDQRIYPEGHQNRSRISNAIGARRVDEAGMVDQFHAHLQPLDESRNHG